MYCMQPGQLPCPYLRKRLRRAPSGKRDAFYICVAIKRTNNIIGPVDCAMTEIEAHYRCPLNRK